MWDLEKLREAKGGRTELDLSFLRPEDVIVNPGSDDESPMVDGFYHEMNKEERSLYYSQVMESDGFDVGWFPGAIDFGLIVPITDPGDFSDVLPYTQLAIKYYNNNNNNEGKNLSLTEHIKWNGQVVSPMNYYITFKAKDNATGEEDTYQALVVRSFPEEATYVKFVRRKPELNLKRKDPPTPTAEDDDGSAAHCN